jgi:serine/threonine protein kinase
MSSVGSWTPNSIVGRYQIVERLGVGGMAEVYVAQARNEPGAPRVAIKRLLPAFANEPRLAAMFAAEARLAATLHHPNIAKVLDVGIDHDVCWFAMELVDGHDVRSLLAAAITRERPIPLATAMSIMYGTTCALAYVHDPNGPHAKLNIVHRDISPSNILVSFAGAIKLVDFGIARIETGATPRTASGHIKGKIPYMSPEQCRARPLDGRSDLFSLGVVLYELTTNRRPFDRDSEFATLEAIVRGEFTAPSRVIKGYPADLEEVVLRLLATRPADRYPAAGALLVDLDRIVSAHDLDLSNAALAAHIDAILGRATLRIAFAAPSLVTQPMARPRPEPLAALSAASRAPIDRIAARCEALLDRVCAGTTDARDLPSSAVAQLIGQALRHQARNDLETAVLELELALSSARPDGELDALIATHDALFLSTFTAFIGDQTRTVAVSQHLEQLVGVAIDQRAAYLLTRIDGTLTVAELVANCGLPRRDACRHLCQLMLRELVVLL